MFTVAYPRSILKISNSQRSKLKYRICNDLNITVNCYKHKPAFKTIVEIGVVCAKDKTMSNQRSGKKSQPW